MAPAGNAVHVRPARANPTETLQPAGREHDAEGDGRRDSHRRIDVVADPARSPPKGPPSRNGAATTSVRNAGPFVIVGGCNSPGGRVRQPQSAEGRPNGTTDDQEAPDRRGSTTSGFSGLTGRARHRTGDGVAQAGLLRTRIGHIGVPSCRELAPPTASHHRAAPRPRRRSDRQGRLPAPPATACPAEATESRPRSTKCPPDAPLPASRGTAAPEQSGPRPRPAPSTTPPLPRPPPQQPTRRRRCAPAPPPAAIGRQLLHELLPHHSRDVLGHPRHSEHLRPGDPNVRAHSPQPLAHQKETTSDGEPKPRTKVRLPEHPTISAANCPEKKGSGRTGAPPPPRRHRVRQWSSRSSPCSSGGSLRETITWLVAAGLLRL